MYKDSVQGFVSAIRRHHAYHVQIQLLHNKVSFFMLTMQKKYLLVIKFAMSNGNSSRDNEIDTDRIWQFKACAVLLLNTLDKLLERYSFFIAIRNDRTESNNIDYS